MAGKSTDWRPGHTVCRCCFADGCYKDISTEYFWMGKREVYSEMLNETFDVSIAYSQSTGPNSNSRLICEPCIARLRDASDFKRQVLECERTFMHHLDPGRPSTSEIEVSLDFEPSREEVKLERVKLEAKLSDDDFDDDRGALADDGDDDDDLDDQPLTTLASKVPKKEAVDLLDLLDNSKRQPEKRKSTTKVKPSPSKKTKKKEMPKPSASKPTIKTTATKKKDNYAMTMARTNARTIIQYATAYPFRLPEGSAVCVYCCESYDDPSLFRKHMDDEHDTFKVTLAFAHLHEGYVKADCTVLRCRTCSENFQKLEDVALHLKTVHNRDVDLSYDLGIQPFIIEKDKWLCSICNAKFSNLRSLSRHTQKHFVKYTCDTCGKSYSTQTSLNHHIKYCHVTSERICRKCKKGFDSLADLRDHLMISNRCCQHVCNICGQRFCSWVMKQSHLREAHATPKRQYPCPECGQVFEKSDAWRVHFKIAHTDDHFQCSCCGRKFDSKYRLNRHMVSHTGEKLFECSVCSKAFPRKSTLEQHMWIHRAVKKWKCAPCDKQFNQRVSWKTHMKAHHPELCDF